MSGLGAVHTSTCSLGGDQIPKETSSKKYLSSRYCVFCQDVELRRRVCGQDRSEVLEFLTQEERSNIFMARNALTA
jgi:hypothetical protein